MRDQSLLGPWVRRFLLEYLVAERNLARNTQVSYRDTLTLLLPFVSSQASVPIERLAVHDVSVDRVRAFLEHIEQERGCSAVTRNQRLSTIHSLARFIGMRSPEHLDWCSQVRLVPFKKAAKNSIGYLDKPEVEALLRAPNRATTLGARDHALLLFLYNSGARADEAASLRVSSLYLGTSPSVRILGKGNKWRVCPLWPITVAALQPLAESIPFRIGARLKFMSLIIPFRRPKSLANTGFMDNISQFILAIARKVWPAIGASRRH